MPIVWIMIYLLGMWYLPRVFIPITCAFMAAVAMIMTVSLAQNCLHAGVIVCG